MFLDLFRIAFGDRAKNSTPIRQVNDEVVPDANEKTTHPSTLKIDDDHDLKILAEEYGELTSGKTIEIELSHAAALLNRKRVKVDAFNSLKKKLQRDYNVELKIYSRRTKK